MSEGGQKFDGGKARFDLIPPLPLEELAEVYGLGAAKYGDRNWEKGIAFGRIFAAMMRHAWAWWRGERHDREDGQHHLASVAWGALCLMELERTHAELDDRAGHTFSSVATTAHSGPQNAGCGCSDCPVAVRLRAELRGS